MSENVDYGKVIEAKDLASLEEIVKNTEDINGLYGIGGSMLFRAALAGWKKGVRYLLDAEIHVPSGILADVALDGKGDSLAITKLLIAKGAGIEQCCRNGNTPLLEACYSGKLELAKYLIKKGADINVKSHKGNTPLISAAKNGRMDVVKLLLKKGADTTPRGMSLMKASFWQMPGVDKYSETNDSAGSTAANMAEQAGRLDIALLIEMSRFLSVDERKELIEQVEKGEVEKFNEIEAKTKLILFSGKLHWARHSSKNGDDPKTLEKMKLEMLMDTAVGITKEKRIKISEAAMDNNLKGVYEAVKKGLINAEYFLEWAVSVKNMEAIKLIIKNNKMDIGDMLAKLKDMASDKHRRNRDEVIDLIAKLELIRYENTEKDLNKKYKVEKGVRS